VQWLNYHHLLYYWLVLREGGVARAAARLQLAPPTVSGQVRELERALGEKLLEKRGRRLVPTEMGQLVQRYADEIFALGQELLDTVQGRPTGQPVRLVVGVADAVPKIVARMLLEPAWSLPERVRLECREGSTERLLAELSLHTLDVVLTETPIPPGSNVRAFGHLLGESRVSFFARHDLARRYRTGFPGSLSDAPMLLPTRNTSLRRTLDEWFDGRGIRPRVIGEFEDSALLKTFGMQAYGVFAAPAILEAELVRSYHVVRLGDAEGVSERYYAVTLERRIAHPAVVAISKAARGGLRASTPAPGASPARRRSRRRRTSARAKHGPHGRPARSCRPRAVERRPLTPHGGQVPSSSARSRPRRRSPPRLRRPWARTRAPPTAPGDRTRRARPPTCRRCGSVRGPVARAPGGCPSRSS
jgi:LysR family transcriptional activator of nhaA